MLQFVNPAHIVSTQPDGKPRSLQIDIQRPSAMTASMRSTKPKHRVFQPGDRVRVKTKHGPLKGVLQTISESTCMMRLTNGEVIEIETCRLRVPRASCSARAPPRKESSKTKIDFRIAAHHKTVVSLCDRRDRNRLHAMSCFGKCLFCFICFALSLHL